VSPRGSTARLAFVVSEHRQGLWRERVERYRRAAHRLTELAEANVVTFHYTDLEALDAEAIVLSGSYDPWDAHESGELGRFRDGLRVCDRPVLGICAGMQLLATAAGGEVTAAARATERGFADVEVLDDSDLLAGLQNRISVLEHHSDEVSAVPSGLRVLARSESCAVEALAFDDRPWWGTQFHPEEWTDEHPSGRVVVENFLRLAGIPLRQTESSCS
jgi:GMP synthase (glutamine-hydrolysing)